MKTISNEEFETALANSDNQGIIHYVCRRFSKQLSHDVLKACGHIGLWKCLQTHDPTRQKFTSSLYNMVKFECYKELNKSKSKNLYQLNTKRDIQSKKKLIQNIENKLDISEFTKILPKINANILNDRYINGMKLHELATKYGYSRQWVQQLIQRSIKLIQRKFGVSLSLEETRHARAGK